MSERKRNQEPDIDELNRELLERLGIQGEITPRGEPEPEDDDGEEFSRWQNMDTEEEEDPDFGGIENAENLSVRDAPPPKATGVFKSGPLPKKRGFLKKAPARKNANPLKNSSVKKSANPLKNSSVKKSANPLKGETVRKSANPLRKETAQKSASPLKSGTAQSGRSFKKSSHRHRRKKGPLFVVLIILCILLALTAFAGGAYLYLTHRGEAQLKQNKSEEVISAPDNAEQKDDGKTIVYDGKTYRYNEDNLTFLLMGVDKTIQETGEDNIGENGQADVLVLAVLDSTTGHLSLVNISRDAMVDVNKYNVSGQYLGTDKMQICLAYSYGDGKDLSCQNTLESVSRLMYGMPVNGYAALDYSAINILNDAVGGVTVDVLEDLTAVDPELQKGASVTLKGSQAETYIRTRDTSVLESNNLRMEREKQYLSAFISKAISSTKQNMTLPVTMYNSVADYMVTNIDISQVTYLASLMIKNGVSGGDMVTVPGEITQGEVYAEFTPDDTELYKLILSVFYKEVTSQV